MDEDSSPESVVPALLVNVTMNVVSMPTDWVIKSPSLDKTTSINE